MGWSGYADDSRAKAADLLARARAGDMQAAMELKKAASGGSWRADHQNAAVDAWNEYSPGTGMDMPHLKNPHHGVAGFVGGALQKLAPLAAFIPGVGPIAAGALAAGGNMLGSELQGNGLDVGGSLLKGGLAGVGNKLLGSGEPKVNSLEAPNALQPSGVPDMALRGADAAAASPVNQAASSAGTAATDVAAPNLWQRLTSPLRNPAGGMDMSKLAQVGTGAAEIYGKNQQRGAQERYMNSALDLRRQQIGMGQDAYASKAPLRQNAMAKLAKINTGSSIFGGGYGG